MRTARHQTIAPVTHDLGAFKVRRALPTPSGRWLARSSSSTSSAASLARRRHARRAPPAHQPRHRHLLFGGAIEHRDSLGSRKVIEPESINCDRRKGIVHSERSPADRRAAGPSFYGMQTC